MHTPIWKHFIYFLGKDDLKTSGNLGRERSFSDVNHHGVYNVYSRTRRPSTIEGSNESISTDEADLETVQCFLPVSLKF